jgi:phosphoglycerate dehydrogenase-like enzyme
MHLKAINDQTIPQTELEQLHIESFGETRHLDDVLTEADYVSLHVPLTPRTRHMIDRRALALMKPTAVLINVARGEIVDEVPLTEALQNRRIAGAGLDVFAVEPVDPAHPLLRLENVIATPHVAGVTSGTSRRRGQALADNVDRVANGLPPLYLVRSVERGEPRYE